MKYFSEVTNKVYDTEDELKKAELEVSEEQKKKEVAKKERAAAAKDVEDAYKAVAEASRNAEKTLQKFCDKYGTFHKTFTGADADPFLDFFNTMFWF